MLEDNLFANNSGSLVGGAFLGAPDNGTQISRGNSFNANTGGISSAMMLSPLGASTHDVSSNLFNDGQTVPEIDCSGTAIAIRRNNVFATSSNPLAQPCYFQP